MAERHSSSALDSHAARISRTRGGRLLRRWIVTKAAHRQVKLVLCIGDKCAHNAPVGWHDVLYAVNSVRDFIETYPMAPWWEEEFPPAAS